MQEYMLFIQNEIDHQKSWSPERLEEFLNKCKDYIGELTSEGKLIDAQPIVRQGKIIFGTKGS